MKLDQKNNIYHNILNIIKQSNLSDIDKAKEITLYLENLLNQQEQDYLEKEELYGGEGRPNLPLPNFGKTFKRIS